MASALAVGVLIIVVGGVVAQWLAWRFRLPAIVLLLAVGLLAGPVFGVIDPGHAIGGTLGPMVGLAVCIVVFEGGLALDFRELRAAGEGVLRLTVVALPISFVLGTFGIAPPSWTVERLGRLLVHDEFFSDLLLVADG